MAQRPARPPVVSSAEILAGVRPTVQLNLTVRLTPSEHHPEMDALLPAQASKELLAQQDRLLKWIGASRENQIAFLTDPLGALERAKIKVGAGELATLRRLQATRRAQTLPSHVELSSLSIEVDSKVESSSKETAGGAPAQPRPQPRRPRRHSHEE